MIFNTYQYMYTVLLSIYEVILLAISSTLYLKWIWSKSFKCELMVNVSISVLHNTFQDLSTYEAIGFNINRIGYLFDILIAM